MKKFLLACAWLLLLSNGLVSAGWCLPQRARIIMNLNKTWKFIKQDIQGAQAVAFNDASWSSIHLPHSFEQPYWRTNMAKTPYIGWYRRHLAVDSSLLQAKKRFFIEFEAAFLVTDVYVNGTLVGTHKGGYTGFSYDITANLRGGDNVIAVRCNANWNGQVAPRAGEHIFSGGIYRDVYLVVTDPLHVTWYGTFVSTPQVSASAASVTVKTEVKNDAQTVKTCSIKNTVLDASNTVVATKETTASIPAGAVITFVQANMQITNPRLWSPATPYLYTVYTEVFDGATKVDDFVSPLGIRTVRWDKDNGFFINEQHLWLQGCNVHQDHAGWCDAITNSGSYRDVKMVKDCGMNFIRGSHYPHDPAFSDACDRLGIALWSEMCFWGFPNNLGGEPWNASSYPTVVADQIPFEQNVIDQLKEMIRIHRNHPSVVIWSMSNEVEFVDGTVAEKAKALLRKMITVAHTEDSTRRAALGGAWGADWTSIGDVNGYNGGEAWISTAPGFPSMQTEYGSCVEEVRPGNYDGCYGLLVLQNGLPIKYPWRSGISIWCGFHHGSNINTGAMGMIDHARLPLRRWYYYRNLYAGIAPPAWPTIGTAAKLVLTADADTITDDGRSDCKLTVQVQDEAENWIANTPDITLTDLSGMGMFPTGTSITFVGGAKEKGVIEGLAAIEYRSYNAGTVTIQATSPGIASSSVTITVKHVDEIGATSIVPLAVAAPTSFPLTSIIKFTGTMLWVPDAQHGRRVHLSVYDLDGKLVMSKICVAARGPMLLKGIRAEGVLLARLQVVE